MELIVYINKHSFSLDYQNLIRPHLQYVVWKYCLKSDIRLRENIEGKVTIHVPCITKQEYHKTSEAMNLPTLQHVRFGADIIETCKPSIF